MKKQRIIAVLLAVALAISGCGGSKAPEETKAVENAAAANQESSGSEASEKMAEEGEQISTSKTTLTVAIDREPVSMDPTGSNHSITCTIVSQMFETLLKFNENMEVVPGLAESYEQVDELTYKFNLRKGVKFHDGEEMKASDVVFSIKRAAEKPISVGYTEQIDLDALEAPDNYTVILKTKEPYTVIRQILCLSQLAIVSEKAVTEMGDDAYARNPVGTGAFKFDSWTAGDNVTIARNDDYWGDKAYLEKVVYRIITEQTSRAIEVESGGVDMALLIPASDYERLEENPDIDLKLYTSLYVRYIAFNTTQGPLTDKTVRQALNYATDIDSIRETLYTDKGAQEAVTVVPPGLPGRNENMTAYDYNPEKARELLKEAGYDNNLEVSFTYLANATNNLMAQMLQAQWADVGVTLTLNPLESGALSEYANGMKQEVMPVRTAFSIGDSGEGLEKIYHSAFKGAGGSRVNCSNDEIDELLEKARVTMDETERNSIYEQVQQIAHEESYVIYLCYEYSSIACSNKMRGLVTPPDERINYSTIYFVD